MVAALPPSLPDTGSLIELVDKEWLYKLLSTIDPNTVERYLNQLIMGQYKDAWQTLTSECSMYIARRFDASIVDSAVVKISSDQLQKILQKCVSILKKVQSDTNFKCINMNDSVYYLSVSSVISLVY